MENIVNRLNKNLVLDRYAAPQVKVRCFMNSLHHSWKITNDYLEAAYRLLPDVIEPEVIKNYIEFIENNELELAMNALDDLGCFFNASNEFWFQLEQAAINMGLSDCVDIFIKGNRNNKVFTST